MVEAKEELLRLRARFRIQTLASLGVVTLIALVGLRADGAVRVPDVDAWKVGTRDVGGALTDRLVATTGVATARLRVQSANVELFPQSTAQLPVSPSAGALAFDSTVGALKFFNGSLWMRTANPVVRIVKTVDESLVNSATLQDDDQLQFPIGSNETWVVDFWLDFVGEANHLGTLMAISVPAGATITYWGVTGQADHDPSTFIRTLVATASGQTIPGDAETSPAGYRLHARVTNGGTSGSLKLQWAQDTANPKFIKVKAGSHLVAVGF